MRYLTRAYLLFPSLTHIYPYIHLLIYINITLLLV